ncbi:MAG: LEM-3-like GIY-YIG domain-containing protein [Acidimicrobiales bacterium]
MEIVAASTSGLHVPTEVFELIGFYIYALRDSRDHQIFYVGKGQGDRVLSHVHKAGLNPTSELAKLKRIRSIEQDGRHVEHLFIRTHLTSEDRTGDRTGRDRCLQCGWSFPYEFG